MSVPTPWSPMTAEATAETVKIHVWDRTYTIEKDVLFTSILSRGKEILAAPIRLVGQENGKALRWQAQEVFLFEQTEEKVTVCATQQSEDFIVNTALEVEYDGYCAIDIKLLPRGRTVAEVFGVSQAKQSPYSLERLWLEIPLKKEIAALFHYSPAKPIPDYAGEGYEESNVCMSRAIPCSMAMPFKPLLWLGNEEQGLCWCADSDQNWEPAEESRAIEIIDGEEEVRLLLHLIDGKVKVWKETPGGRPAGQTFPPLSFRMGLQATPVKPFPSNPYKEKILHIDCFKKIAGEYDVFLAGPVAEDSTESGYDRIKRLGVTTLVIHEKWNKIQNYWNLSCPTVKLAKNILRECHARGIKVIPYFGFELSTLNPYYTDYAHERVLKPNGRYAGGWYRQPNQRAYRVCFTAGYAAEMIQGVKRLAEEFGFDGVYLDSNLMPIGCIGAEHGCGYTAPDNTRRPTYPMTATRTFMKDLYAYFEPRGKMVNSHISNCCNIPALSFSHLNWDGEAAQTYINANGIEKLPPDYLRTEYSGRNFGIPYEFLAYTFENWSFRDSLSVGLIHGMLSRPNDIGEPLEIMAPIWRAIDRFPMEKAVWKGYWSNGIALEGAKLSYYEAEENGRKKYLVFLTNPTEKPVKNVTFSLANRTVAIFNLQEQEVSGPFDLAPRESLILTVNEK